MLHSDIAQVGSIANRSTLIGLGESSHGTHEFFINKFEIFKQLVTKHGFNTMLFEDNQEHRNVSIASQPAPDRRAVHAGPGGCLGAAVAVE